MSLDPLSPTLPIRDIQKPFDLAGILNAYWQRRQDGYLTIQHSSVTWWIYCHQGELVYITHSVDPSDRIDGHLRRLSHTIAAITPEVRSQVRHELESLANDEHPIRECQVIGNLIRESILSKETAQELCCRLSQEALEFLWPVEAGISRSYRVELYLPYSSPLNLKQLLNDSYSRITDWCKFSPLVWSPYQRPYLMPQSSALQRLPVAQQENLGKILRGYSFRQLGILLKQDELALVQKLFPLIQEKAIILRDPQEPYTQLPDWKLLFPGQRAPMVQIASPSAETVQDGGAIFEAKTGVAQQHRIVCIDDSPAILQTIERFLGTEDFCLKIIDNSVTALLEIMRFKPDLILMDVGMPKLDGYELCKLIRRNSRFKVTPIIMVTGNTGLIDRAKAKLAGATDYMTKPFTQDELLKMVLRHVS
jgi:two-component system, chemotaxis family, response regulator PixG